MSRRIAQTTCLRKLILARFDTLNSFTETTDIIYQTTADRINKLLHKSQVDLTNRQKFGIQAAMVFTDAEVQILLRSLVNLHHICNNQLQASQLSNLKPKEMSLDALATPAPATTASATVLAATTNTIGFYSSKRKENPEDEATKSKKAKSDSGGTPAPDFAKP